MTAFHSATKTLLALILFAFVAGCGGESTQDKFMRIAQERAKINAANRADDGDGDEDSGQAATADAETAVAENTVAENTGSTPQPAQSEPTSPAEGVEAAERKPMMSTAQADGNGTPSVSTVSVNNRGGDAMSKREGADAMMERPNVVVSPNASLPRRDQVLAFSRFGQQVAFVGSSQAIGVYDVDTKSVQRLLYNPQLSPFSLAISENGKLLAAGGVDGGLKVFPIEPIDGLDRFQQNRLLRQDASPPRRTHDGPVSAIAVNDSVGIVATGGADGEIKLWSTRNTLPLTLTGNGDDCVDLLSYQDDQLLFAAHRDGVSYWRVGEQETEAASFSKKTFLQPPTTMVPGIGGKGVVVGDAGGRVSMWTLQNNELVESNFSAHNTAIDAIGFSDAGDALVTVARDGDIAKWNLPVSPQRSFDIVETPPFVVVSPDGRIVGMPSRDENFDLYAVADGKAVRRHSIGSGKLSAAEFSGDGSFVALATDSGRVYFQDASRRPIAYRDLAKSKIDRLRRTHDGKNFAFTTESGSVGLAAFPRLESNAAASVTGDLAAANRNGSMLLIARGSDLRLVRANDGSVIRSGRINEGTVTSIALDDAFAIIGTSTGTIQIWPMIGAEASPETIAAGIHAGSVVAVGMTRRGSVWSCDASGLSKQTPLKKQQQIDRGKFDFAPRQITSTTNGAILAIDADGKVRKAARAGDAFEPFADEAVSQISAADGVVALIAADGKTLNVVTEENKAITRMIASGDTKFTSASLAKNQLVALASDGSAVAVELSKTRPAEKDLPGGEIRNLVVSPDGRLLVFRDGSGHLYSSSLQGNGRKLILPGQSNSQPMTLSSDGRYLVVATSGRTLCYEIGRSTPRLTTVFDSSIVNPSAATFTADAKRVIFAMPDAKIVSASIEKADDVKTLCTLRKPASELAFDAAGKRVAVRDRDGGLTIVSADDGSKRYESTNEIYTTMTTSAGQVYLADNSGSIRRMVSSSDEPTTIANSGVDETISLMSVIGNPNEDANGDTTIALMTDTRNVWLWSAKTNLGRTFDAGDRDRMPMGMELASGQVSLIESSGKLTLVPSGSITPLAPIGSDLKTVAISRDGKHVIGRRDSGAMIGYKTQGGRFGSAAAIEGVTDAVQVTAIGSDSSFAILASDNRLVRYTAEGGATNATIQSTEKITEILAGGRDDVVVIRSDSGVKVADFRRKTIDTVRTDLMGKAAVANVLPITAGGTDQWLSIDSAGGYAKSNRLTEQDSAGQFQLEQPATSVIIAGGYLFATEPNSVRIVGDDGKTVGTMPTGDRPPVSIAVHPATGNVAACDPSGTLLVRFGVGGESKRIAMPMPGSTSLVWSIDGSSVAATNGDRVAVMDVQTGTVQSQLLVPSKPATLVHWDESNVYFLDRAKRLDSFTPPRVRWDYSIDEKISDVTVSGDGKSLFVCSPSGMLIQMDATTGELIKRVNTGRPNLRELTPLPDGGRMAMLAGNNEILVMDKNGALADFPSLSALGLRSLDTSDNGRFLFGVNDGGQILSWDFGKPDQTPSIIPCDVDAQIAVVVGDDELIAIATDRPAAAVVSSTTRVNIVAQAGNQMADSAVSPNGQFVAISDRSEKIQLRSLVDTVNRELISDRYAFGTLAIHPSATHVAAIGANQADDDDTLVVWETVDLKQTGTSPLGRGARLLTYSRDGGLLAVGFDDGHIEVFDASSASRLESLPPIAGLRQIAFTQDGSKLLIATDDGKVQIEALTSLGRARASGSAIVTMGFHGGGKYLLCGSMKGEMTLWSRAAFSAPQAAFKGLASPILHTAVSTDGRYVLSVYDDNESSTMVWDLNSSGSTSTQIDPRIVIRSDVRSTAASFTSDSKFLLIGGIDGVIRAWSLDEGREVARFRGHEGPVMDIAPLSEPGRFVSGGIDLAIRSWKFPSSLPSPGADIPQGALADATEVSDLAQPQLPSELRDDDPFDAARQALIAGAGTTDILDLMKGAADIKDSVKESLARVLSLEKNGVVDAAALSNERRQLASAQRRLDPTGQGQNLSSFVGGFTNMTFMGETNFKFGLDKAYRPVRLLFADRFLYAARPSATDLRRRSNDDDDDLGKKIDEGDNGALLSWDFKYSGLQAHAWSTKDLNVQEVFSLRDSGGVFTVPQMMLFNQDGSSRQFGSVASWAMSHGVSPERQYLAVGSAGGQRAEDDILKVFDISDFAKETISPYSQYRSFEGVVTAMAFANNSASIAFSVRERAVHRLFIADAETLRVRKLEEHNHDQPYWDLDNDSTTLRRNSDAAVGVTSLAFSPDDGTLLVHGEYKESLYKLSTWKLSWDDSKRLASFEKNRRELENNEGPFFIETGYPSVRFVAKPGETSSFRRVLVRIQKGFSLVNIASEKAEQQIDFLSTHHGIPEYAVSDDGRWIIMGDDNGMAYVWDSIEGDRYSLTMTIEMENRMKETKARIRDVGEKPAHSGPIVGVALSDPDPGRDYPAFAATIGEENKIKVWELFPILDPEVGVRARN